MLPSNDNWVCYLLECADGTLYCGITNDLDKRLAAHNAGEGARYTRGRIPVRLVHVEPCAGKPAALRREMQIKQMTRDRKRLLCADAGRRKPVK
ncbi:MAG: GIY-YIG nuclease family protein [Nitrosomonadales bacterium]|nr:GIY-YIG nuclease family protein [Nitrosomonadales bacterium]